jgi:cation:H+ antiporter
VLIGSAVLCIIVFATGWTIRRMEGALFVALYAAYLGYVVVAAL